MMIVPFVASTTVYALLPTFNDPVFQSQLVKACNKISINLPEHQSSGYIIYKCTRLFVPAILLKSTVISSRNGFGYILFFNPYAFSSAGNGSSTWLSGNAMEKQHHRISFSCTVWICVTFWKL